jgi:hypothetical protein
MSQVRAAHLAGERKVVTILFADVVTSTALTGRVGAEDWTAIINGAFERLSPVIERSGDTLGRLMRDLHAGHSSRAAGSWCTAQPPTAMRVSVRGCAASRRLLASCANAVSMQPSALGLPTSPDSRCRNG